MKRAILLLLLICAAVLGACTHFPSKEAAIAQMTDDAAHAEETPAPETIQRSDGDLQTASGSPEGAPTVTAIVLSPVERGANVPDYSGINFREVTPETEIKAGVAVTEFPTEAPAGSTGFEDKMSVLASNPMSGSTFLPGQSFHLDVTLRNEGTTVWQTTYKVVEYSNMTMSADKVYYLPMPVAPGGTVLISIYMTAPAGLGSYNANFMIQDAYGVTFGYFDYVVTVGEYSVATEIATLTPTVTPTYYSADGITATPDTLAWMCIDMNRSLRQDCYLFCVQYPDQFPECYYDGVRYETPEPNYE